MKELQDLLQAYSIQSIIIILIAVLLAIRGGADFFEWLTQESTERVHREDEYKKIQEELNRQKKRDDEIDIVLEKIRTDIEQLTGSDKEAIKSHITEKHHFFVYKQGWIDDYSLDCLERRFEHYQIQGGNSFIEQEMDEIRNLPRRKYDKVQQSKKE